jgi:hypothetical protein
MNMDAKKIAELRSLRGQGMISAVGEYTPDEFWDVLDEIERLQGLLFQYGAMEKAPCFCCGYNGPGYFNSAQHPCAINHKPFGLGRQWWAR